MTSFRYKAIGSDGRSSTGVIEASDRRSALDLLSSRGLFPSSLELERAHGAPAIVERSESPRKVSGAVNGSSAPKSHSPRSPEPRGQGRVGTSRDGDASGGAATVGATKTARGGRISRKEVTAFTRQMSTLLAATIPIPSALDGLAEQAENPALAAVIHEISSEVRRGEPFSAALARHPRLFSVLFTSMVEVGEESGQLGPVLDDLADFLEDQDEMRGEVAAAIAYPAFVLVLGVTTTVVLLTFVMPRLLGIMTGLTDALPLPTRILLAVSEFSANWWHVTLVALVLGGTAFVRWTRTDAGRVTFDRWRLSWPVMGKLFRAGALARFSRTLGTLHHAGVSLLRALDIVRNTVGNQFIAHRILDVAEETKGGDSLAEPIRRLELFPSTMIQMIRVGEETGRLDEMLLKVAQIQEKEMRSQSRALISLLGPLLIVAVGALVGFIVIALLLPIFQISQGMG
ncbi:MAG: type II secretion system F family protein [Planctomycetes bacterium]|nr:type II secretion system F family protein [Planctomycetota bacterium]